MMNMLGSITSLFMFSIFVPMWELNMRVYDWFDYNWQCEIDPDHPVPCDYKLHFLPQLIVYLIIMAIVVTAFAMAMIKRKTKDGITEPKEEEYWKCGMCYVNVDVNRILVK